MQNKLLISLLMASPAALALAQSPTVTQDIYSRTDYVKASNGTTVVANAFPWYVGGGTSQITTLPALLDALTKGDNLLFVDNVFDDSDGSGVSIGWDSDGKRLTVDCDPGKVGRLEMRVFSLNGMQLAYEQLTDSSTSITLDSFVPDFYIVAITEDGKLIKTLKLHLK